MDLPSSGRPISLLLHVYHFAVPIVPAHVRRLLSPYPRLLLPHAQRTSRLRENLRKLGEEGGGEASARLSKRQGMTCSASTMKEAWALAYYQRKRAEGKTHGMAVRALANVWVRIIYKMWSEHTCYETAIFEVAQHQHAHRAA